jgi:hypothetical protein
MNGEFISDGEASKLVPPFKGDKQEVLANIYMLKDNRQMH